MGPGATISGPTIENSSDTTAPKLLLGRFLRTDGETFSVTTTLSFGPGTLLIGRDQGLSYFIPSGCMNTNTNVHFQRFASDVSQATATHDATYGFTATAAAGPSPGPGSSGSSNPLETRIVKAKVKAKKHKAAFEFSGTGGTGQLSYQCQLKAPKKKGKAKKKPKFKTCGSPKKLKRLKGGRYEFSVRAVDGGGAVDATPAKKKFKIKG